MAGKYALYLPYKIYTAAADTATDAEFGAFIRALLKYDMDGTEPEFADRAFSMLFESVRPEMDFNHKRYDALVEKRREAGKRGGTSKSKMKTSAARENGRAGGAPECNRNAAGNRGGAPKGNKNASKSKPGEPSLGEKTTQPKHLLGLSENNSTKNNLKTTPPENLTVIRCPVTNYKNNSTQAESESVNRISSSEVVFSKQPTTTTILHFQNECKRAGFSLDKKKAEEILQAGIDPSWLSGAFNFVEYTAGYICEAYPDKPRAERRKLFVSSFQWEDHRDEFREWREKKIAAAAKREQRLREEAEEAERRILIAQERETAPEACDLSAAFRQQIAGRRRGASP